MKFTPKYQPKYKSKYAEPYTKVIDRKLVTNPTNKPFKSKKKD